MSGERLTQKEIDDLFEKGLEKLDNAMNTNVDGYQPYDFNRPDKFNLENIRSLRAISNSFARSFSQIMSASLRLPINFKLSRNNQIEQLPYASEYVEKMVKDYYAFCVVELGKKDLGKIIIEIDLGLALAIHRNLCGRSKEFNIEEKKPMTEIEKETMEEWVTDKMFGQLAEAFQNVENFNFKLEKIETDPQYVKVTRNSDMIVLIPFDIEIGDVEVTNEFVQKESVMRICIPYLAIEPVAEKLTTENSSEYSVNNNATEKNEDVIKNHLSTVECDIEIELGKNQINLKELLTLKKGDVLPLEKYVNESLIGYIDEKPKFSCIAGQKENRVAVKIQAFAEREGDYGE